MSEALGTAGANIPEDARHGGMTVKFVQSSDNKYVQFRLTKNIWSTDTDDWALCSGDVLVENPEYIHVETDKDGRILWAIKTDGSIYWGAGIPQQVIDYVAEKISELSFDEYEDIVAFLGNLITGDKDLQTLLNEKVDKVDGKSLIDAEYAEGVSYIENPEYIRLLTDSEDKIIEGTQVDGTKVLGGNLNVGGRTKLLGNMNLQGVEYSVISNSEYIAAWLDASNKVIFGFKADGKTYVGDAEFLDTIKESKEALDLLASYNINYNALTSFSIEENPEYLNVELDSEDKVLGGRKTDGFKQENVGHEINGNLIYSIDNLKYLEAKLDSEGKLIEGVTKKGEKFIGDFDESTKKLIKSISGVSSIVEIPLLDSYFNSPIPLKIYNTKGSDDAKYVFDLPLSENAFNIRFKFKVTENILNLEKTSVIAKLGGIDCIIANVNALTQHTNTAMFNDEEKTMYYPTFNGGIEYNSMVFRNDSNGVSQNIGLFAFSIKYTGNSHNVTVENNGNSLVMKVDNFVNTYSFNTYQTVFELYEALKATQDIEVSYNEIEGRNCSELAKFAETKLVAEYYTGINGDPHDTIEDYWDAAPLFIPYATDEYWHQAEIVKINGMVYTSCDGNIIPIYGLDDNLLTLGGDCGVLFKDLVIDLSSSGDAEIVNDVIISSANPYIIIHEGHGIIKSPTGEVVDTEGNMGTTVDRLQKVYSAMIAKGYTPVSVDDIESYYAGRKTLPKRCFTSVFDDYNFVNCLDLENRAVFTRFDAKPSLAIISDYTVPIYHNGAVISESEAARICKDCGFSLLSHTRNHRSCVNIKPSEYISELSSDVYSCDVKSVDGSILVYPYGHINAYLFDTLKWLGFRLGIVTAYLGTNTKSRDKYALKRVEIGLRVSLKHILNLIY